MLQGLVGAQAVAQGLLALGQRQQAPIGGSPSPQSPPEALEDLGLWTVAGPARALQMRARLARLGDEGPPIGGVVDHEHHAERFGRGISSGDITPVPRQALLQAPLPRLGLLPLRGDPGPLHQASGQPASHEGERTEEIHPVGPSRWPTTGRCPVSPTVVCRRGIIDKRASS
jgi:hypothetical protein